MRPTDWTRQFEAHGFEEQDTLASERVSGKGDLTRRRTVTGVESEAKEEPSLAVELDIDEAACQQGTVISVHGLHSLVETADGTRYQCAVRRLLKTLTTDQRHVVVAGDHVLFRPVETSEEMDEGIIERVEPRHGTICRTSRKRQHLIATNIDQLLIVSSAAEPDLKPHLIDRFLIAAEKSRIPPVILINKIDLVDPAGLQPLVGVYSQMGYQTLLVSAATGAGLERLRQLMASRHSAVAGQSGVGKSSLLNAIDPSLQLKVTSVSQESQKGRHTTTTARLLRMATGGYVVDTPGIRQFQLWDVIPEEVGGYFRDIRPFINCCRFPDCTHTHEEDCAVKDAVADDLLDERRYESYCHLLEDAPE